MAAKVCLKMKSISKQFPGVLALNEVDFDLREGEVHVLMGENGAGKSTLMKILGGIYQPDEGEIFLDGIKIVNHNPADALKNGISMIHQELSPIPEMTISENIFIGREPALFPVVGLLNRKVMNAKTREFLKKIDLELKPDKLMKELSVGQTQMVEIAKAISYDSKIIIMDEPTSAITDKEVEQLFEIIAYLKKENVGIIYISHKMEEIVRIADRITVLRDGELIATSPAAEVTIDDIITKMVGREIKNVFPKEETEIGEIVLEVKKLTKEGEFYDVSFSLRRGEILGIAGLMGAGRTELVETIFGIRSADSGSIKVRNKEVVISRPKSAIREGIAIIPEDRKNIGLNLKGTVKENVSLVNLGKYCSVGLINNKKETAAVNKSVNELRIKTPGIGQQTLFLSGGNQQKVVVAKWLLTDPDICILDEPTRGIDVGAKVEIHKLISNLSKNGKAVIMVSSELPEIMGMSDRVLVMHEGRLKGELKRNEFSQEKIMSFTTAPNKEDKRNANI